MAASFMGSLAAWIITGIFAITQLDVQFTDDLFVKVLLVAVIILVGIYYFYSFGSVELVPKIRAALLPVRIWEWCTRVVAMAVLFTLWFAMQSFGWRAFAVLLVVQHITYLIWDFQVRDHLKPNSYLMFDIIGAIIAVGLYIVTVVMPSPMLAQSLPRIQWFLGGITTLYSILVIWGIWKLRHDLDYRLEDYFRNEQRR